MNQKNDSASSHDRQSIQSIIPENPDGSGYLLEWLRLLLDSGKAEAFASWRQILGTALEAWDLIEAERLVIELAQHELAVLGQAHLHMGRGALLAKKDQWNAALQQMKSATVLFERTDDIQGRCWALLSVGNLYDDFGDWKQAALTYREVIDLFHRAGNPYGEAQAFVNLGTALYNQSDWRAATEAFRKSLDVFLDVNDVASAAIALSGLGHVLTELGEYQQAVECYETSLQIFAEANNIAGEISSLNNLGRVYDSAGELDRAVTMYEQSLQKAMVQGDLHSQAIALDNLGVSLGGLHRHEESISAHERALAIFQDLGDRPSESASLNHLGLALSKIRDYERAERFFSESLLLKRNLGDERGVISVMVNLAELHLVQEHWERTKEYCEEAVRIIGNQPFFEPLAITSFLIGLCHWEAGDRTSAFDDFSSAIRLAWDFNSALGQRVNRSIVRHFQAMEQRDVRTDFAGSIEILAQRVRHGRGAHRTAAAEYLLSLSNSSMEH